MLLEQLNINLPLQLEGERSESMLLCRPSSASRSVRMQVGQKTVLAHT